MRFGRALRQLREQKGLKHRDLRGTVSRQTLTKIEAGRTIPTNATLVALLTALGESLETQPEIRRGVLHARERLFSIREYLELLDQDKDNDTTGSSITDTHFADAVIEVLTEMAPEAVESAERSHLVLWAKNGYRRILLGQA